MKAKNILISVLFIFFFSNVSSVFAQVFDCASRDTETDDSSNWMYSNNIVAELDYYSWKEHGLGRAKLTKTSP